MKISPLVFLLAPAYGFVPTAKFGARTSLSMATETESATKVRSWNIFVKPRTVVAPLPNHFDNYSMNLLITNHCLFSLS